MSPRPAFPLLLCVVWLAGNSRAAAAPLTDDDRAGMIIFTFATTLRQTASCATTPPGAPPSRFSPRPSPPFFPTAPWRSAWARRLGTMTTTPDSTSTCPADTKPHPAPWPPMSTCEAAFGARSCFPIRPNPSPSASPATGARRCSISSFASNRRNRSASAPPTARSGAAIRSAVTNAIGCCSAAHPASSTSRCRAGSTAARTPDRSPCSTTTPMAGLTSLSSAPTPRGFGSFETV